MTCHEVLFVRFPTFPDAARKWERAQARFSPETMPVLDVFQRRAVNVRSTFLCKKSFFQASRNSATSRRFAVYCQSESPARREGAFIATVLGRGGSGKSRAALAIATKYARAGKKVLLTVQPAGPINDELYGNQRLTADPQEIQPGLFAVHLRPTTLLERLWEYFKAIEKTILAVPVQGSGKGNEVFGVELPVLPGMDTAIGLYALWQFDQERKYDVIVYDGRGDLETLRALGSPEVVSWYARRFRSILENSELYKVTLPFAQAAAALVFNPNAALSPTSLVDASEELLVSLVEQLQNPCKVAAVLVSSDDEGDVRTARWLWGSAQQVNITVAAVFITQPLSLSSTQSFEPLPLVLLPTSEPLSDAWAAHVAVSVPEMEQLALDAPTPVLVDIANSQINLFLPGFRKDQVRLSQSGPELTVEVGDQRRNLFLPNELKTRAVSGASFKEPYLIVSF